MTTDAKKYYFPPAENNSAHKGSKRKTKITIQYQTILVID